MKAHVRFATSLLLAIGILTANLITAQAIEPRYIGITRIHSYLDISSSGAAKCDGSGTVTAGGTYFVTSGHDYVVTTTATVYDSNGKIVESPSKDSAEVSY